MLKFLDNMDDMEAKAPGWIDWARNPHAVRNQPPAGDDSAAPQVVQEEEEEEYVPIGMHKTNPDNRICRCGSRTHMVRTAHICPLNDRYRDDEPARLRLYVPRRMWRWYDCADGERRKFFGKVMSVGEGGKLCVKYDNGDEESMSEEEMLKVFVQMKRDINTSNKRKRAASSQTGKRVRARSCRL